MAAIDRRWYAPVLNAASALTSKECRHGSGWTGKLAALRRAGGLFSALPRSMRTRIVLGSLVLLALQLGVAFAVWRADNRLEIAMAKDVEASAAGTRLSRVQTAFGQARLRLFDYLRTGGAAERAAVDEKLAALGVVASQMQAPDFAGSLPLSGAIERGRQALSAVVRAVETRRVATASLDEASAELGNLTEAIALYTVGTTTSSTVSAAIPVVSIVGSLLVASGHYAQSEDARSADIARTDLDLARRRLADLHRVVQGGTRRLQRLMILQGKAFDNLGTSLTGIALALEARQNSLAALEAVTSEAVRSLAAEAAVIATERERRHSEMLAARLTVRNTVLGATVASLGLGLMLSWLIGIERRRSAANLKETNLHFDSALNNMSQGLCMYDAEDRLQVFNNRFCELYGVRPEQLRHGMSFRQLAEMGAALGYYGGKSADEIVAERVRFRAQNESGSFIQQLRPDLLIEISVAAMTTGGWVATFGDITEQRRSQMQIEHMAHHDALTDLPNRVLFHERMEQALTQVERGGQMAVMCLDLDQFKAVNDTLGHPIGDALLRAVAERLLSSVRDTDTVARLGGDEFAILQIDLQRPDEASALAARLVAIIAEPYELQGHHVVVGTSIGVTLSPQDATSADRLLKNADIALYRAKADGRGTYCFFEPDMDLRLQARRELEIDLRQALENQEFELHYQPLVSLCSNRISGFEALLRWNHPRRGTVSPVTFIPLAEEMGLIIPVGEWVLRAACLAAARWPSSHGDAVRVAVNLSAVQFKSNNLVQGVVDALEQSGLPAHRLELEITESVMLQDSDATLAVLHQLRGLGIRICMDDFGTGYSSLSYLRRFPFDKIKIDQSFVRGMSDREDALAIIRAITGLGKHLGMSTTAEGVETEDQLAALRREGCTEAQGYLFSRPRPAHEIAGLLMQPPAADLQAA